MTQSLRLKCFAQLVLVALSTYAVKLFYSTASVNQLRWILAPTAFAVELVTGMRFDFEPHSGYMNSGRTFVIAASCAGVNFLIASFLMLAIRQLWIDRSKGVSWRLFAGTAVAAYVATIVANTIRIAAALGLHGTSLEGLSPQQLHRFEGVFIYFGCLLLMFMVVEKLSSKNALSSRVPQSLFRRAWLPLTVYYAITLGVPLINGAYRQGTGFWEHSLFVLVIPILLMVPVASFGFYRRVR